MKRMVLVSLAAVMIFLVGAPSSSQAQRVGDWAGKGAGIGALVGLVAGDDLGDVAAGALVGAAGGAVAGSVADSNAQKQAAKEAQKRQHEAANKAQAEQQKATAADKAKADEEAAIEAAIGRDNYAAYQALVACEHKRAHALAQAGATSANADHQLASIWVQAIVSVDENKPKEAESYFEQVVKQDPDIDSVQQASIETDKVVLDVRQERRDKGIGTCGM